MGLFKKDKKGKLASSINDRERGISLLGALFDNVGFDRGGWRGERDESSIAQQIRGLIQLFEQDSSDEAARALVKLASNPKLSHWHSHIKYVAANQLRTMREAKFTYPDVSKVVATLANAEPANVTDLKALVIDALKDVAKEIRHGNTDGWKSFWNLDPKKNYKAGEEHVNEETARDRLLELLRPKLRHIDIAAEPEVRYAEEKRADIAIYCRGMKLPIEIKCDYHDKLWSAAKDQLQKQYSRDPEAEGNGIYLAFWFDSKKGVKNPPKGIQKPVDAGELKGALIRTVPEESRGLIDVMVIDVSVPEDKKATKTGKVKK